MEHSFFNARNLAFFREVPEIEDPASLAQLEAEFKILDTHTIEGFDDDRIFLYDGGSQELKWSLRHLVACEELIKNSSFLGALAFRTVYKVSQDYVTPSQFELPSYDQPEAFVPMLTRLNYYDRASEVQRVLTDLWAAQGQNILLEVSLAKSVVRLVSSTYSKALPASTRYRLEKRWASQLGFPSGRESLLYGSDPESLETKMLKDLNLVLERKIQETKTQPFKMATATEGNLAFSKSFGTTLKLVLISLYTVGELGSQKLMAMPKAVYDAFAAEGATFIRSVTVENDPRLFETASRMWDHNYEENFGTLRDLVATARALL